MQALTVKKFSSVDFGSKLSHQCQHSRRKTLVMPSGFEPTTTHLVESNPNHYILTPVIYPKLHITALCCQQRAELKTRLHRQTNPTAVE